MKFLEVSNLAKSYGSHRAVAGISFTIEEGECFGLLGPNGAGKSTLLSILSGFLQADEGKALLQSELISPDNPLIRPMIGLAPQEIAVYGALTARENLQFFGKLYGLAGTKLSSRVDDLLVAVGLAGKADHRVETFSGGMQRRMNLAAALVHQPRMLLLDEPTAGVDPQSRNHLFQEIQRCSREGMTIIYTTHYMEEVEALCSKVAIMDHGKLVALDTLKNLLGSMHTVVTLTFDHPQYALAQQLQSIPGSIVSHSQEGNSLTIESRAADNLLTPVIGTLTRMQLAPVTVETRSPTLERVFLQLTGRALRD